MANIILDTNVIVRYLVKDHQAHYEESKNMFVKAESGRQTIIILPVVVAEVTYVLKSYYQLPPKQIASTMQVVLSQRWIHVEERTVIISALEMFATGMHFVDAYLHASAKENDAEIFTFDQKLAKKR